MTRKCAGAIFALGFISLLVSASRAEEGAAHTMMAPADVKWGEVPPTLPRGAKMAVVYGDPGKAGAMFVLRLKMPAGYKVPPHWHPTDETISVVSGTALMGMGDKLDAKAAKPLSAGGFAVMPAKEHHYVIAKTETVVQVSSMGPFVVNYINPEDDPSKAGATKAPAPAQR